MKITPKSEDGNSGGTIDNKNQMEEINNAITLYYLKFIKEFREALDGEFGKGTKSFPAAILNANRICMHLINKLLTFQKWVVALFRLGCFNEL